MMATGRASAQRRLGHVAAALTSGGGGGTPPTVWQPAPRSNKTYVSGREDGRFMSTMGLTNHLMKTGTGKLAFDPAACASAEARGAWQAQVREKLVELMAFPDLSATPPPPPPPVRQSVEQRDGYRLERWAAFPEPGSVVPFLALIPDGAAATAVMCFPGSHHTKERLAGEPELRESEPPNAHHDANKMALEYVKAGFIALAFENPGIGELDETPEGSPDVINAGRDKLSVELIAIGRNYVGLSVFQKLHIMDWLCDQSWADTSNGVAVCGHSLGTEPALMMAVIEPRISAIVFNDFLTHNRARYYTAGKSTVGWRHISPLWHLIPGLLEWFDFPDLLAALAPDTKLLITEGGPQALLQQVGVGRQWRLSLSIYVCIRILST